MKTTNTVSPNKSSFHREAISEGLEPKNLDLMSKSQLFWQLTVTVNKLTSRLFMLAKETPNTTSLASSSASDVIKFIAI